MEDPTLTLPRRLRPWVPLLLVAIYWATYAALGMADIAMFTRFMGRAGSALLLLLVSCIWWMTRRAVPLRERLLVLAAAGAGATVFTLLRDPSVLPPVVLLPAVTAVLTAGALWLAVSSRRSERVRRLGLLLIPLPFWGAMTSVRMEGLIGEGEADFRWRWTRSQEDEYLAERDRVEAANPAPSAAVVPLVLQPGDWPGFRGPDRDGAVHGIKIASDWDRSPPRLIWKRRIGPGWSSLAVVSGRIFTQEQRGPVEAVVSLDAATGSEVWAQEDQARFEEALGGPGPRATPTFSGGWIYALGATGVLNCLDATTGVKRWSREITADSVAKVPMWGFSSSPLVAGDLVVVFAGGEGGKGLLAYQAATGEPAWTTPAGRDSYSSPHLASLGGVEQLLFVSEAGISSLDPRSGSSLWSFPNAEERAVPAIQPHAVGEKEVLVSFTPDAGTTLLDLSRDGTGWRASPRWTSRDLKPFFNDFVRLGDALYGFDGSIFCCVDLRTGVRRWKGGRYGNGQVLLIADQPLLLIMAEKGEAVLVAPNPDRLEEVARFLALEGKTWNHPVIAGGRMYLRNSEEIACYEPRRLE